MKIQKIISLFVVLLFTAGATLGQNIQMNVQDSPNMHIYGDSNIKKWDAAVNQVSGTLTLQNMENLTAENVSADAFQNLSLTIPVEQIESESGGLTSNIHKYLKGDDYPNITFDLNNVSSITQQDDGSFLISGSGVITAAGEENAVDMQVTAMMNGDGIQFTGEKALLMTDFGIDPPTAVFGTIRARDEMRIEFDVSFSR